jgi:hypothetical protein
VPQAAGIDRDDVRRRTRHFSGRRRATGVHVKRLRRAGRVWPGAGGARAVHPRLVSGRPPRTLGGASAMEPRRCRVSLAGSSRRSTSAVLRADDRGEHSPVSTTSARRPDRVTPPRQPATARWSPGMRVDAERPGHSVRGRRDGRRVGLTGSGSGDSPDQELSLGWGATGARRDRAPSDPTSATSRAPSNGSAFARSQRQLGVEVELPAYAASSRASCQPTPSRPNRSREARRIREAPPARTGRRAIAIASPRGAGHVQPTGTAAHARSSKTRTSALVKRTPPATRSPVRRGRQ